MNFDGPTEHNALRSMCSGKDEIELARWLRNGWRRIFYRWEKSSHEDPQGLRTRTDICDCAPR